MAGLVLLGLLMFAVGVFCTRQPGLKAQVAGWAGVVFFGACLLAAAWQVGRIEPVLVIDRTGVDYRRLGVGVVPWDQILDVGVGEVNGQRFLTFTVRDEAPYLPRLTRSQRVLARCNAAMGFPLLTVSFTGTNHTIDQAIEAVEALRP